VLDDMLHPGYPTLMVAVRTISATSRDVRAVRDRSRGVVAATKFVLCRTEWFKRYGKLLGRTAATFGRWAPISTALVSCPVA
jgi:hypothetical protein